MSDRQIINSLRPAGAPSRCPYCHAELSGQTKDIAACPACGTTIHRICWDEHGGCPVLGCPGGTPDAPPPPHVRSWHAEVLAGLSLLLILVPIVCHRLLESRKHGQEAEAISSLRTTNTNEVLFRDGGKRGDGNNEFGMLSELSNTGLIDALLGSGTKRGYFFRATYSVTTSEYLWFGTANPMRPDTDGDHYFEVNADGIIWFTTEHSYALDNGSCVIPSGSSPLCK